MPPSSMRTLQSFDHLMQRTDSLEKTLMLGKIEGGRRRGQQRDPRCSPRGNPACRGTFGGRITPRLPWRNGFPLALRVVHGVTGHLLSCEWNLRVFPDGLPRVSGKLAEDGDRKRVAWEGRCSQLGGPASHSPSQPEQLHIICAFVYAFVQDFPERKVYHCKPV